ncbi:hypothetical protein FEQ05_05081 [Burkholderia pseudomultivorans]|uniref:Uncharacterized protein n=1 Tax=Burkholderia pseudomultivorans TaxID=1207504 RepID=A0ABU2EC57_9BURK|nr:hypothetical protein [Burkholderia pseudomultivorans]TCT27281.1 hypothetical protein EC918_11633 [Burkholderia vietnamiensis]MDR8738734.1 hypothetical protein [Burkholderia pseudomultivorans]MDR8745353.1 hypothetical protein [Burkholderia pseudomultivorans]MDR8757470.1 hypothetical protein [Burkholderia pseudomultivorans]
MCARESQRAQLGSLANLATSLRQERNSAPVNSVPFTAATDASRTSPSPPKKYWYVYLKAAAGDWRLLRNCKPHATGKPVVAANETLIVTLVFGLYPGVTVQKNLRTRYVDRQEFWAGSYPFFQFVHVTCTIKKIGRPLHPRHATSRSKPACPSRSRLSRVWRCNRHSCPSAQGISWVRGGHYTGISRRYAALQTPGARQADHRPLRHPRCAPRACHAAP